MAGVNDVLAKSIKAHLVSCGLDSSNAAWCADRSVDYFKYRVCNSKDPFKECCDHAGLLAGQRSLTFKYQSPKSKAARRSKKPQEVSLFDVGGGENG